MLKAPFLWASTNPFMAQRLPKYRFVKRAVKRFMPGETLAEAMGAADALEKAGFGTLITELGENVDTAAQARKVVAEYMEMLAEIDKRGLEAEVSVKLTHLGLDQGVDMAINHTLEIAKSAKGIVWIDMEYSSYVDRTIEVYRGVQDQVENVGLCLQSYLFRTEDDFEALLPLKPNIRLVKGAYMEPPEVAHPGKAAVDGAYRKIASRMMRERHAGRMGRVCIGTHDSKMISDAGRVAYELGMPKGEWEVAMLYGIRTEEQKRLLSQGIPTRVLISYGAHWFPWYMRRLAERPANVGFVLKSMVKG